MEKNKLQLGDILQLEKEINGVINPETGVQEYEGFLKQNISIILKYELTELGEFLTKERKKVESLRDELIKKYGTEENGTMVVKMFVEEKNSEGEVITRKINPEFIKFDEEYGKLLSQEIEFEHPAITKEDLKDAGKTKDRYQVLFKLIKKD